jgi:hypothetical protein
MPVKKPLKCLHKHLPNCLSQFLANACYNACQNVCQNGRFVVIFTGFFKAFSRAFFTVLFRGCAFCGIISFCFVGILEHFCDCILGIFVVILKAFWKRIWRHFEGMFTGITAVIFVEYLQAFVIEAFVWHFGRHFSTKHLFFKKSFMTLVPGKRMSFPFFSPNCPFFLNSLAFKFVNDGHNYTTIFSFHLFD